ncbi:MAG: HAD hydrolase family protein [Bacilli bacterium]
MIKLIATDLDGTLFYPKNPFIGTSAKNKKFLRRYIDNGGQVLVASGRSTNIIPFLEKALKNKITLLGCNGGFICEDNQLKENYPLDSDKLLELYVTMREDFDIICWFLFDEKDTIYISCTERMTDLILYGTLIGNSINGVYRENLCPDEKIFLNRIATHNVYKMMPIFGLGKKGRQKASEAYLPFKAKFGDCFDIAVSNNSLEITSKGADKGSGIEKYCLDNNIDKNDVIVIGDSGNDLSMFGRFPHSFCMEHSPQHIKSQANHVVKRVYDLEKYLSDPELLKNDKIRATDYEKGLSNL